MILLQLVFHTATKGLKRALQVVAQSRDQHPLQTQHMTPVHRMLRRASFLLAIGSSFMLFALRSTCIPGTDLLAVCYIASYILNFILNLFGTTPREVPQNDKPSTSQDKPIQKPNGLNNLTTLASLFHLPLWAILIHPIIPSTLTGLSNETLYLLPLHITTLFIIMPGFCIFGYLMALALILDVYVTVFPAWLIYLLPDLPHLRDKPVFRTLLAGIRGLAALFATSVDTMIGIICILVIIACATLRITLFSFYFTFSIVENDYMKMEEWPLRILQFGEEADPYCVTLSLILIVAGVGFCLSRLLFSGLLADTLRLRRYNSFGDVGFVVGFLFLGNVVVALIWCLKIYDGKGDSRLA